MKAQLLLTRCLGILALTAAALVPAGCNKGKKNTPDNQETGVTPNPGGPPGPTNGGSTGSTTAGAARSAPADPNVYGYSFGESTVPFDSAPKFAPLRARKFDTCFKLTNARKDTYKTGPGVKNGPGMGGNPVFGPPPAPGAPILVVDYQVASESAFTRFLWLVLRSSDGQDAPVWIGELEQRAGSLTLIASDAPWSRGPFAPGPGNNALPQNVEMYLIRKENRYGKDAERSFKVSNSVFLGQSRFAAASARDWTSQEAAVFVNLPIEPPKPGLNPGVGEDTPFAGKPVQKGPRPNRIVDATQPLIGVDVRIGSFPVNGGKEDCLSLLVPIYDRNYPDMGLTRILAKPGYAVGGVLAKSNNFVNAIQVTFMKLKADNSGLDPKDSYTSAWVGPQQAGIKETRLGGDGRKVIGVFCNQAAVLDGFALVMDSNR